jgi:hypothetical protein
MTQQVALSSSMNHRGICVDNTPGSRMVQMLAEKA